jgi:hypothetical protein
MMINRKGNEGWLAMTDSAEALKPVRETIDALRRYKEMSALYENTLLMAREIELSLVSPRTSIPDGMPHAHAPKFDELRIVLALDRKDRAQAQLRAAKEFLEWFEPAWCALTDKEKAILNEFYMSDSKRSGATSRLMELFKYSRSHVDRLRVKALRKLSNLLHLTEDWNQ